MRTDSGEILGEKEGTLESQKSGQSSAYLLDGIPIESVFKAIKCQSQENSVVTAGQWFLIYFNRTSE